MLTYDCRISLSGISITDALQTVGTANGCCKMHAAYCDCKDDCAEQTFPKDANPSFLEVEEQCQCNYAVSNSDNAGSDDVARGIYESIIHGAQVTDIVHAND